MFRQFICVPSFYFVNVPSLPLAKNELIAEVLSCLSHATHRYSLPDHQSCLEFIKA